MKRFIRGSSLAVIFLLLLRIAAAAAQERVVVPTAKMSNGYEFPLVGIGVGNLAHESIESVLVQAIGQHHYRLVDTNRASNNEALVAKAIEVALIENSPQQEKVVVNVVTKIWYTHLGYERTKMSVMESLKELHLPKSKVDVRVHMLIHWPYCDDNIEWMNCEQEEADLEKRYKKAGKPPHLNKEGAWKESWRALEDLYNDPKVPLASIGVSNFNLDQLKTLKDMARIQPHLLQGNAWTAVHDPHLMKFVYEEGIVFQAYASLSGVVTRHDQAPNAYQRIHHLGNILQHDSTQPPYTASQVVLAWLLQNNVSVIPRTSSQTHIADNSPSTLSKIPRFTPKAIEVMHNAVSALMTGRDMGKVTVEVVFTNVQNEPVDLFWRNHNGEDIALVELEPNVPVSQETYPNHIFVAVNKSRSIRKEFEITVSFGETQQITVNLTQPKAQFTSNKPVNLYWSDDKGEEVPVSNLAPGQDFVTNTHPGHVFVAYDESNKTNRRQYQVRADYGDQEQIHIEL